MAGFSAPKIPDLNRHEEEAVLRLVKRNHKKAAVLYILELRRLVDRQTGVVGDGQPVTASLLLRRLNHHTGHHTLRELLAELERVRLITPLPAPKGRLRFMLGLLTRVRPGVAA